MELEGLWQDLKIKAETKANLKKDLSEGKVPQLPYFIIGIPDVKTKVAEKINEIDQGRMITSFIIAKYGNGKTNLLKYLELFFDNSDKIKTIYLIANPEQPDLGMFLLKQVQDHFTDLLLAFVIKMRSSYTFESLTNNNPNSFKSTKEYCDKLFEISKTDEEIKRLIYLGTGRLYSKSEFSKFQLQQLTNYERKEVLVLFLNILAINKIFVIFQIDEIENIYEKSKLRLNAFFTSYRELYDMFSFIKGHYLLCCYTDANADSSFISGLNDAFHSRIKPHILYLNNISGKEYLQDLVLKLNTLFDLKKPDNEIDKIVKELQKEKHSQNRELLRSAISHLKSEEIKLPLQKILENFGLLDLYTSTYTELDYEGLFKSINQKFFDPLEAYLEGNFMLENGEVKSRDFQSFIDNLNKKTHYFILNENLAREAIQYRVDELIMNFGYDIIIYAPNKIELKNGEINASKEIEIVDYEPQELYVLLNMYRDNFEFQQELTKIITTYTNKNL